ncbi:MAG: ATP-dependent Clp protease ATP-binding subunit ClpX, partial [Oscillospiraceae bacterium]|nr:ATP-dependent Clp protease ATP-binding subunit ClpX [Oscillospiraceae bacterium]
LDRQIGARGLRAVLERIMQSIMYDIPSDPTIQSVTVTRACIADAQPPKIVYDAEKPRTALLHSGVSA